MWIAIVIVAALAVAWLVLPTGIEVFSTTGKRKWGLIIAGMHIPVPNSVIVSALVRLQAPSKAKSKDKKRQLDLGQLAHSIWSRTVRVVRFADSGELHVILDLVVRLFKALHVRVRRLHVVVATPDPALTGVAYGMACAAISILPPDWPLSVDADWTHTTPEISYRVNATVIPGQVFLLAITALWKFMRARRRHMHRQFA